MIDKIRVKNFKSHKDTYLSLGNLTVLSGQNGVGKSSILQALLLLRQTHIKGRLNEILDLNDPLCYIGKTKDALYQFSGKDVGDEIIFSVTESSVEYSWQFETKNQLSFLNRTDNSSATIGYEHLSLFNNFFQYISAARSSNYETDDYAVEIQRQISIKEGKGELTAQFLNKYQKSLKVLNPLKHSTEEDEYLLSQTTAWEREISIGVNVFPQAVGNSYEILYSFDGGKEGPTDSYSSRNVGFGLSYSLPIIVSILSSEPNSILLIENPEAHIHPYGQAKLAELICLAAQAGIQLIVETHSDHIINGILVQCKRFEKECKGVDRNNVKIYHFDRGENHASVAEEVGIDEGGRLKNRPHGFFDQIGKDIRKLI